MSEARNTPEPWVAHVNDDGSESSEIRASGSLIAIVYGSEDFPCITDEDSDTFPAECVANALLIAAAPEMLSLLKQAYWWAQRLTGEQPGLQDYEVALDSLIAKAEGRQ